MESFRSKLAIGALVVGSFVGVANAAQEIVFDEPLAGENEGVLADFGVNRDLGRAWIDVEIVELKSTDFFGEARSVPSVIRRQVDGLYYDSVRKQVLYRMGTETVVCAEDASFLWATSLKSTGNCLLTPSTEVRTVDDGFTVHEQKVAKVIFEAQTSGAPQHAAASDGMIR